MKNSHGIIAFIATLVTIIALSKLGGNGSDLAIMTALCGILGMLAPGLVPSRGRDNKPAESPTGQPGDPVAVKEEI